MFNSSCASIPLVATMEGGNSNGNGGFGDNGWWVIIILALLFGWGRNGQGGFGGFGGGSGIADNYVLATDFASIERKIDGVNAGLCDGFYAQANLISGVNQNIATEGRMLQNTLCQGFNGLNTSILTSTNTIQAQLADCCCGTQRAIDGVNYNIATQSCDTRNVIQTGIRDLIDNQNANYRALHDEIVANRIEDKNAQIAALTAQVQRADLMASQAAQNAYLLNELKPCPSPAYVVPNPNCCYGANVTFSNPYTCGCGC